MTLGVRGGEGVPLPRSFAAARHLGQRLSWQQATRHCSGKSAIYAARIGNTVRSTPSGQVMSTPSLPAVTIDLSIRVMQWWKRR
jgi:hypothetical protein